MVRAKTRWSRVQAALVDHAAQPLNPRADGSNLNYSVDLADQLLNIEDEICQLQAAPRVNRPASSRTSRVHRLTSAEVEDLVARYEAGESTRALATDFGRGRETVSRALRNAGVELRRKRRRLTDTNVTEAAHLYSEGWTLSQLGQKFNVGQETIRRELLRAGHQLRPRGGRR